LTWRQLQEQALHVARSLIALEVKSGDRVAVWAPNIHEWVIAALGIHTAGAVLVPVSTRMKGLEAADVLQQSESRVLICIGDFLGQYFPAMLEEHPLPLDEPPVFLARHTLANGRTLGAALVGISCACVVFASAPARAMPGRVACLARSERGMSVSRGYFRITGRTFRPVRVPI